MKGQVHALSRPVAAACLTLQHDVESCSAVRRYLCLYGHDKYTKSLPHSILRCGQGILWLKPDCACPTHKGQKNRLQLRILCTRGKYRNVCACLCSIYGFFWRNTLIVTLFLVFNLPEGLHCRFNLVIKSASSSQSVMTHLTVAQERKV